MGEGQNTYMEGGGVRIAQVPVLSIDFLRKSSPMIEWPPSTGSQGTMSREEGSVSGAVIVDDLGALGAVGFPNSRRSTYSGAVGSRIKPGSVSKVYS